MITGNSEAVGLVERMAAVPSLGLAIVTPSGLRPAVPSSVPVEVVGPVVGARTEGCPCCRVRLDLVDAVLAMVRRVHRPGRVVVLVESSDDVVTVAHTVLSDPDLRRRVRLDAVLATVDAARLSARVGLDLPVADGAAEESLAIADRILVAGADRVTDHGLGAIGRALRGLNRLAPVLAPARRPVDVGELVDLDAWHGAPRVGPTGLVGPAVRDESDRLATWFLGVEGVLDPDGVEELLDSIVHEHARRLLRMQGAFNVAGEPERVCCHGVRSYAMSHSEAEHHDRRSAVSTLVLVGRGLPGGELAHRLVEARIGR